MKNISKKIRMITTSLALTLLITPISVFASTNDESVMNEPNYTVSIINPEDVPHGITPIEYDSEIDAKNDFENTVNELKNSKIQNNETIETYDYNGTRYASKSTGGINLYLNMYVGYTAKWNSTYGNYYASANKPTTDISGLTMGYGWRHNSSASYSNIGSNPTKLTARGSGYLDYYLVIEGIVKIYTETITIDGSWGQP